MLGLTFDGALTMSDAIAEVVTDAGWKLRTLRRTKRYYKDAGLIGLYKAHVLSFIEYRTPAVYHALRVQLDKLDSIQTRFMHGVGVNEVEALIHFNLAPLRMRRDIAMLGIIHRAAIGEGPPQFKEMIRRRPGGYQLQDPYDGTTRHLFIKRSIRGPLPGCQSIIDLAAAPKTCPR